MMFYGVERIAMMVGQERQMTNPLCLSSKSLCGTNFIIMETKEMSGEMIWIGDQDYPMAKELKSYNKSWPRSSVQRNMVFIK